MKQTYRTFIRSCTNWETFSRSRKTTDSTGLIYDEARERCDWYNNNRNSRQIKRGTKMEFEREQ